MNFNMQQLMRQAQTMQKQMEEKQSELEQTSFEGISGGGLVKLTLNGKFSLESVKIDPKCVDPEDTEMLEDLITSAYNNAYEKVEEATKDKMGGLPNGLGNMF